MTGGGEVQAKCGFQNFSDEMTKIDWDFGIGRRISKLAKGEL